jgi:hypothetical protein
MNKITMKIKLTEGQINTLKAKLAEEGLYNSQEPKLTPKQELYQAMDKAMDDEYSMDYKEFGDVIAEYFNEFYGAHLKEDFLKILNEKINSLK